MTRETNLACGCSYVKVPSAQLEETFGGGQSEASECGIWDHRTL